MRAATLTAVIVVASVNVAFGNIVTNGGFEAVAGTFYAGEQLGGWTVGLGHDGRDGGVTVLSTWVAAEGERSIDLSGVTAGAIFQDLGTIPGADYVLRFAMSGNPDNYVGTTRYMQVIWAATGNSRFDQTFSFDTTGCTRTYMQWAGYEIPIHATHSVTRLSFYSLTDHAWGPALDAVSVTLTNIPEPASASLLVIIGFLIMMRRVRRAGLAIIPAILGVLFLSATSARANVFNMPPGLTSLEMVTVGNPGNAGELSGWGAGGYGTDRVCGAVDYGYRIGKYEVTAGQYCQFLNSVAKTDTYGLYNTNMWSSSFGCNIQRGGSPGSYTYSVALDWANRPVNYVSWGDAARFCNWIANGQPSGSQDLFTTENGSYYLNGETDNALLLVVARKSDAEYVIPSEDEWYKAAYHKSDGVTGNYFDYPTSSDAVPSNDLVDPDPGNNATYYEYYGAGPAGYTIGSPYYHTEVGAHEASGSPYGTFDQGGNVFEWTETVDMIYDSLGRVRRGGCSNSVAENMHAANRNFAGSTYEEHNLGFRVVEVPEPATLLLLVLGGLAVIRRR